MLGERVRISFKTGRVVGKETNDGYWYLRPIDPEDHSKGWRITFKLTTTSGERISSGSPIEGYDPVEAVKMFLGFIHQEIIETHTEIKKNVTFCHTFPAKMQSVVVTPPKTLGLVLTEQIQRWHSLIPGMVQDYNRVRENLPEKGWPLVDAEPFPWDSDPAEVPKRSPEFDAYWKSLKAKAKAKMKKTKKRKKR